jgi:death-on-curing protein
MATSARVFVTALMFLRLNGYAFRPETIAGVRMMESLATGEVSEADFAQWLSTGMSAI